ncbi:hypothetical protein [Ascidiimonas sp. W6]|uniref:hypothetical protein n=1 Tax=Ascidiimonas meishanensis TaxID=3128903 RepID=UPI0030ECF6D1
MPYTFDYQLQEIAEPKKTKLKLNQKEYEKLSEQIFNDLEEEIQSAKDRETGFQFKLKKPIDRKSQLDLTLSLFRYQAEFKKQKLKKKYKKSIKEWVNSGNSASRLVIVDANGLSMNKLAETIINGSPLERLLIVGLDDTKRAVLEQCLKSEWKKELSNAKKNIEHLRELTSSSEEVSFHEMIDRLEIKDLLGPNLSQEDYAINKDTLATRHPQFDANLEDILFYGRNEAAAKDITFLGKSINGAIPTLSIKSTPFTENSSTAFTYAVRENVDLLKFIADGRSQPDILASRNGEENDSVPNVSLAKQYSDLLSIEVLTEEMKRQGLSSEKHLDQDDIDYLRKTLFEEVLYEPYISPKSLDTTISAAASIMMATKAREVSSELIKNLYSKYTSSVVELAHGIANVARDGGSDQIQESLKKANVYKLFFQNILKNLRESGVNETEVTKIALAQTTDAYLSVEKLNKNIYELENSEVGAEAYRNYGLRYTNKVHDTNEKAVKILNYAPYLFGIGVTAAFVGTALFFPPLAVIPVFLISSPAINLALDLSLRFLSAASMRHQMKGQNQYYTKTNVSLAEANMRKNQAHSERNNLLSKRTDELNEVILSLNPSDINHQSLGSMKKTSDQKLEYPLKHPSGRWVTKYWPTSFPLIWRRTKLDENQITDYAKKKIEEKVDLLVKEDIGGTGKLEKMGNVDSPFVEKYTNEVFSSIAHRINLSNKDEYDKDLDKLINSGASRSRLVIVEAPKDLKSYQQLAQTIYDASPQDRLLLVGLDSDDKKNALKKEMKILMSKRLELSTLDREVAAREVAIRLMSSFELRKNREDFNLENFLTQEWNIGFDKKGLRNFIVSYVAGNASHQALTDEQKEKFVQDFTRHFAKSEKQFILNSLTTSNLIKPHLFQSDLDISIDTLRSNHPQIDVNVEEVLLLGETESLATNITKLGLGINNGVPTFSIKTSPFPDRYIGHYKCSCKDSKTIMKHIASAKSASELLGKQDISESEHELNRLARIENSESIASDSYENVTMSPIYSELFNLKEMKNVMPMFGNVVDKEDLEYMKTILFDSALYEANMSPEKSTQTISKAESKISALSGKYVARVLPLNIVGQPYNIIEELKYNNAQMALDTGVDFVNEKVQNANLYRSMFDQLLQKNVDDQLNFPEAVNKAFKDTFSFYLNTKNDEDLSEERAYATLSREFAYDMVNDVRTSAKQSNKPLKRQWAYSTASFVLGATSLGLAISGVGLPLGVGIGLTVFGFSLFGRRLLLLNRSLRNLKITNKHIVSRSNRLSKNATLGFTVLFNKVNTKMQNEVARIKGNSSNCENSILQQEKELDVSAKEINTQKNGLEIARGSIEKSEEEIEPIHTFGFDTETSFDTVKMYGDSDTNFLDLEAGLNSEQLNLQDIPEELKSNPSFSPEIGTYILENLPADAKTHMPYDELNDEIKKLFKQASNLLKFKPKKENKQKSMRRTKSF